MDERNQIEEMARHLCCDYNENCYKDCNASHECYVEEVCRALYNAGYRKQSEGEWIEYIEIGAMNNRLNCSVCNWQTPFCVMGKREFKFCPNCGAKMKGD